MELHTPRSLFDKWNDMYEQNEKRIKQLKEKQKQSTNTDEQYSIEYELEELLVKANLIHQLLADLGLMVYVEENKFK